MNQFSCIATIISISLSMFSISLEFAANFEGVMVNELIDIKKAIIIKRMLSYLAPFY